MDNEAIAEAIEDRRRQLRLTLTGLRDRTSLSQSQISAMANASRTAVYRSETLAEVSRALAWPSETLERVGAGGRPPGDDRDRFTVVLERLDGLEAELARCVGALERVVGRLEEKLGNARL